MKKIEIHFWGIHIAGEFDLWFNRNRFFCKYCDGAFNNKKKLTEHENYKCEHTDPLRSILKGRK